MLDGLRTQLAGLAGSGDDGGGLTADQLKAAGVRATARQIDALVALGILGRRVGGGEARIFWAWDRADRPATDEACGALVGQSPAGGRHDLRAEEFQLDLAADYEHERLLAYRVILAFEIVGAIVLIREIATTLV